MKDILKNLEDHFCAAILLIMTLLTFVNVVARYIFLMSMPFVEELTRLGLMILSLLGAAIAFKRGAHLGLSVLTDMLPKKISKFFAVLADLLGVLLGLVLLYYGYDMVVAEYVNKLETTGMQWPEWIFGIWVPVGGLVLVIRNLQLAVNKFRTKEDAK